MAPTESPEHGQKGMTPFWRKHRSKTQGLAAARPVRVLSLLPSSHPSGTAKTQLWDAVFAVSCPHVPEPHEDEEP